MDIDGVLDHWMLHNRATWLTLIHYGKKTNHFMD